MRYYTLLLLGLSACILTSCESSGFSRGTRITSVRTTAYTHGESDHIVYGAKTAVGTPVSYTHLDVYKRQPLHRRHRRFRQRARGELEVHGALSFSPRVT